MPLSSMPSAVRPAYSDCRRRSRAGTTKCWSMCSPSGCTPGFVRRPTVLTTPSTDVLPLVPGIDGVGRMTDGRLVYFVLPDTTLGSMAEQSRH